MHFFPSFWWYVIPAGHFLQKSLSGNPKIDYPLLPTTKPHPLLPLTHGPPPLYWLDTSGWCLNLVCAPLSYKSMAYLLSMHLPLLGGLSGLCYTFCYLFFTSCGVDESLSLHSLHLFFFRLGLAWVWALLPSVRPLSLFSSSLWVE